MSTAIEWTDETWNPVTGCTKVSPGCDHCYAETLTKRFAAKWGDFETVRLKHDRLYQPLGWQKPRRVFTCSMADLFHKDVPDTYLDRVFGIMAAAEAHTFQVLTKRSSRMRRYARVVERHEEVASNIWLGVSAEDRKRLVRGEVRGLDEQGPTQHRDATVTGER